MRDIVYVELPINYSIPLNIVLRSMSSKIVKEIQVADYPPMFSIIGLPSGIYSCTIFAGAGFVDTVKLIVL